MVCEAFFSHEFVLECLENLKISAFSVPSSRNTIATELADEIQEKANLSLVKMLSLGSVMLEEIWSLLISGLGINDQSDPTKHL